MRTKRHRKARVAAVAAFSIASTVCAGTAGSSVSAISPHRDVTVAKSTPRRYSQHPRPVSAPVASAASTAAVKARMPEQVLRQTLASDRSAQIDSNNRLYFADPAPELPSFVGVRGVTVADSTDAFMLHSFPAATRKIFLDFTGNTAVVPGWNNGAPIVSAPLDLDGTPTSFSLAERAFVTTVWRTVAEDFAPWQVDVTTQDPGLESLRMTAPDDNAYGIRVVLSPTSWRGKAYSGISFNGSFDWDSDTPNYVFTEMTGSDAKFTGDIASHEVGHTLGLLHDGQGTNPYYEGSNGWAPIMGNPGYQGLTQWSKGEYAGANNSQDDIATIDSFIPRRQDETGSTPLTAKPIAAPTALDGVLSSRSDSDSYKVTLPSGRWLFSATPTLDSAADTNLSLNVYNASGARIARSNPRGTTPPAKTLILPAGTFYVRVDSVGEGLPAAGGYSDYASLGFYRLTVKMVP